MPHRHDNSSELFYILDGAFDLLVLITSSPRGPAFCWSSRREGSEPAEVLLGLQDRFDTHFLDSPAWERARSAA